MADENKNPNQNEQKASASAPAAAAPAAAGKKKYPERARVRTASGDVMRHLHTNEEISGAEKKIDLDGFAIAQIEAGKWVIVQD